MVEGPVLRKNCFAEVKKMLDVRFFIGTSTSSILLSVCTDNQNPSAWFQWCLMSHMKYKLSLLYYTYYMKG